MKLELDLSLVVSKLRSKDGGPKRYAVCLWQGVNIVVVFAHGFRRKEDADAHAWKLRKAITPIVLPDEFVSTIVEALEAESARQDSLTGNRRRLAELNDTENQCPDVRGKMMKNS